MAIIPNFFMESVVALGVDSPNGGKHWIGTGFVVAQKNPGIPDQYFLITNKHVVNKQTFMYVRFNTVNSGVKDLRVLLIDNGQKKFSEHPNPYVDIVAIYINKAILEKHNSKSDAIILDSHSLNLAAMKASGVEEGTLVYALGFPMNLVDDSVKAPICRLGCISKLEHMYAVGNQSQYFLVDAQTFPGNSGGPVFSRPENISIINTPHNSSANLIGILSANIAYQDTLISNQTKKTVMIREENSGLTVVFPVDRIKEVVNDEMLRVKSEFQKQLITVK